MPRDDEEFEIPDADREYELELESGSSSEDSELERELEASIESSPPESEFEEIESGAPEPEPAAERYAERFYELSQREFESERELDERVNGLLTEMERDFFFKGLWKKLKSGGKALLKKGLKKIGSALPGAKWITQLARGNLKGLLSSLAKAGISVIPGGAAALPALGALGFETGGDPEGQREAWRNFVTLSREAYDHLAASLNESADDPAEASRLAAEAFHSAFRAQGRSREAGTVSGRKRYRVRVGKGDVITVRILGT